MPLVDYGLTIDNLIGIRATVFESFGLSVAPGLLIDRYLKNERLIAIDCAQPIRDRKIYLWWLRSPKETKKQSGKIISWRYIVPFLFVLVEP